jgi:hypothetical protein
MTTHRINQVLWLATSDAPTAVAVMDHSGLLAALFLTINVSNFEPLPLSKILNKKIN